MSYDHSLDKDRLYFTQCNDTICLRCPVCTAEKKVLRHCKMHKNFPSLWWHIRKEHTDLVLGELEDIIQILTYIYKAFKRQMFPKWAYCELKDDQTTTSSLLFDGKPPRTDVLEKLRDIARLYKQSQFYPKLTQRQVVKWASVILGNVDSRTSKKYFDCVTKYSKKNMIKGEYNVSGFCDILGV